MRIVGASIFITTIFAGFFAHALSSTTLLPAGINSPSFRYGYIQGIDQRYSNNGTLLNLGDSKSVVFTADQLAKFSPDAHKLITALNSFGAQNLGNDFNLGVLKVDTTPRVKYFAPVYARGVTSTWTLGLGVPVINYTNKIVLSQQYSNMEYYRQQFGGLSPELDAALNTNLGVATNQTLAAKGYVPLASKDETFLGDIQLVSLSQLYEDDRQRVVYSAQLSLPTGPQYNADDLAELNVFGRTTLNNMILYSRNITERIFIVPYVTYFANLPDKITARVPVNEDDTLPDATSKETVRRKIGNTASVGGNVFYEAGDVWTFGTGYEFLSKSADVYEGDKNSRYDLLQIDTASTYQRVKAEISYSTVKSYFKKTALIPTIFSYEISDTVAGVNVERQLVQEMNLMLFF